MTPLVQSLAALKLGALAAVAIFGATIAFALMQGLAGPISRGWTKYTTALDAQLRLLFLPPRGTAIALGQTAGVVLVVSLAAFTETPFLLVALVPLSLAPHIMLEQKRKARTAQIESKLDGFALTLANATRATPSIGRALELVQRVLPQPLDQEIELVLREMRVGSSVDQALTSFSARVRSSSLDAVLSGILIGRQVGGNLPLILETTSSTLREMGRLEGVLRTKTAEAKAQTWVLAVFPLLMVFGFNTASPGFFNVLTHEGMGIALMTIAILLWVSAILLVRKILSVQL